MLVAECDSFCDLQEFLECVRAAHVFAKMVVNALLPADMEINRCVCSSSLNGSCEDQRYSAGNGSNCSVQVAILHVLLRLWRPLRLQPGVHCMLPVRKSIMRFLLRPTCRVHVDALWEVRTTAGEAHAREQHDGFSGRGVAHSSHLRLSGHFDNEINLAGSGALGHESRQHQAPVDRFVFPLAAVSSFLEAFLNEVYLLPKELDEKMV